MSAMNSDSRRPDPGEQARHWVVREASGEMDEAERHRLQAWLAADPSHADAYRRERAFWDHLGALESHFPSKPRARKPFPVGRSFLAMAACLAVVVLVAGLMPIGDIHTAAGEIRTVELPDGSRALLDADSAFDLDYGPERRRIELRRGRVWFQVAHNAQRPFEVRAEQGVARAVGTAFQVSVLGQGASVSVTEGVVSVRSPEEARWRPVTVRAGEGVVYRAGRAPGPVTGIDANQTLSWSRGRLNLRDRLLGEALTDLERYRPGRILLLDRAAAERPVSAMLSLDHLDQGLEALVESEGLSVLRVTPYLTVVY